MTEQIDVERPEPPDDDLSRGDLVEVIERKDAELAELRGAVLLLREAMFQIETGHGPDNYRTVAHDALKSTLPVVAG